jgi:hypothetical protein
MSAFTISISNMQQAAEVLKICEAYNQRRAAIHQTPRTWNGVEWADGFAAITTATEIQSHLLITEIQSWIENNCGSFMPPAVTDYDAYAAADFKTISQHAAAAGQTAFEFFCSDVVGGDLADGWRRSTTLGTYATPGQTQTSDFWRWQTSTDTFHLWQDITLALSALKITKLSGDATYGTALSLVTDGSTKKYVAYGNAYSESSFVTQFDASGSTNSAAPYAYSSNYSGSYFGAANSCQLNYYVPASTTLINSVDIYFQAEAYDTTFYSHGQSLNENALAQIATITPTGTGTQQTPTLLTTQGSNVTFVNESYEDGWKAATTNPYQGLIRWNFTYNN